MKDDNYTDANSDDNMEHMDDMGDFETLKKKIQQPFPVVPG